MDNLTIKFADWYMYAYPNNRAVAIDRKNGKVYLYMDDYVVANVMMRNKISWCGGFISDGKETHYSLDVLDLGDVVQKHADMVTKRNLGNKWMHRRVGKLFTNGVEIYMLCQVEFNSFCLINLGNGNRLMDPSYEKDEVIFSDMEEIKG